MGKVSSSIAQKCFSCSREGSSLSLGIGLFRDFDSDFSYGVPICHGCGGLGLEYDSDDFRSRTERIMELRFAYCPIDDVDDNPLPPVFLVQHLEALVREVQELLRGYEGAEDCYAQQIADGDLQERIDVHRRQQEAMLKALQEGQNSPEVDGAARSALQANAQATVGNFDAAESLFEEALEQFPQSSVLAHDYAMYHLMFRRSGEDALTWLETSLQREPQKWLHFFQTARVLKKLEKPLQEVLDRALLCPDTDEEAIQAIKAFADGLK